MLAQSMTFSGVGRDRKRAGPSRRRRLLNPDVHADQLHDPGYPRQIQVRRPDNPRAVSVDELMIDDVPGQFHLASGAHHPGDHFPRN